MNVKKWAGWSREGFGVGSPVHTAASRHLLVDTNVSQVLWFKPDPNQWHGLNRWSVWHRQICHISLWAVCFMFFQPGSDCSTGLANVHFTTRTRNSIDPCLTPRVMLVSVYSFVLFEHCVKGTRCLGSDELVYKKHLLPFVIKCIWLERCFKSRIQ